MIRRDTGLTLLELIAALAVAAVALGIGAPAMRWLVLDAQRSATINAFLASAGLARSAAVRRELPVVICPLADGGGCELSYDFSAGWLVFVNEDGDEPPQLDASETVLQVLRAPRGLRITANRETFQFRRIGRRATNGTVTLCDARGHLAARAVIVSYTGRARVASTRADGRPLEC